MKKLYILARQIRLSPKIPWDLEKKLAGFVSSRILNINNKMARAILIICVSMLVCELREPVVRGPILQSQDSSLLCGNSSQ